MFPAMNSNDMLFLTNAEGHMNSTISNHYSSDPNKRAYLYNNVLVGVGVCLSVRPDFLNLYNNALICLSICLLVCPEHVRPKLFCLISSNPTTLIPPTPKGRVCINLLIFHMDMQKKFFKHF